MGHARVLAAIGAVLLAASCATSRVATAHEDPRPSASGTSQASIAVGGTRLYLYRKQDSVRTIFLDLHNPRLLYVRFARERTQPGEPEDVCAPLVKPFAYVARQNATSVTIGIAGYRPRGGARAVTCVAQIVGYERLPLRLDAPLGNRAIGDDLNLAGTPPVQIVTDHSVPTPAWVPSGYRATGLDVTRLNDVPERVYRYARWELDIQAGTPQDFPETPRPNTHVDQYPGSVQVEGDYCSVTWTVSANRTYQVDAFTANQANGDGTSSAWPHLTAAQVLRVASSVP